MEFNEVIRKRTATRMFSDKKLRRDDLLKILEAGNLAPTAKNLQPQIIYVIEKEDGLNKIDKVTPCRYNAPCCLLVCSNKEIAFSNGNCSTYEMDATIVATHMILEATNLNIDSTWIKMFEVSSVKEAFNLDQNIEPICIINLGYREEDCKENPNHNIRKNINETVKFMG